MSIIDLDNPPEEARPYVELYELTKKRHIAKIDRLNDELNALKARLRNVIILCEGCADQRGACLSYDYIKETRQLIGDDF